jgi:hypothetical protein
MNWTSVISGMEYPHWLMIAGGMLVAVGFIGFVFQKNTDPHKRSNRIARRASRRL